MNYCKHCDEYYEGDLVDHLIVCDSPSHEWEGGGFEDDYDCEIFDTISVVGKRFCTRDDV